MVVLTETFDPFPLFVDGKTFDHDRVNQTDQPGATEEWRLVNTSPDWRPFHVISVNGEPVDPYSREDTPPIPAFGEIVIRSRFLDFPGKFIYHCHILDLEDKGMLGVVEVVA